MVDISQREIELPEAVIGKLLKLASENKDVYSLGAGEPNFNLPEPLIKVLPTLAKNCNHYSAPGGRTELKEALVKKLSKDNKIAATPDNIIVTCGSQEALLLAIACTLDVSEQVIIPDPSFMGYLPTFELLDTFPVPLPLSAAEEWNINPDALKKLIDPKKTKVIIINTPANPTGNVLSRKLLEEVADIAIEHDLYIFSDEAYEKLVYGKQHVSIGSLNGMENNVVTFQTFSKSYAMCGFRVGYAVGPRLLVEAMTKAHIYTTLAAPTIGQQLAVHALSLKDAYIETMRKAYDKRRRFIVKRLNEIGLPTVTPYGAFYTFSNIHAVIDDSFKFSYDLLKKAKVAVMPGKEFGSHGEGYIRCSYATDLALIAEALTRIEHYILKHKRT